MITMSQGSRAILRDHGALPAYGVELTIPINGTPTTFELDWAIQGLPVIRSGLQPRQRAPELTNISILLDNSLVNIGGQWARFFDITGRVGSVFYDASTTDDVARWHGGTVVVKMGVNREKVAVMTGLLVDVQLDSEAQTAELIVQDPLAQLKKNTVKASAVNTVFTDVPPAYVVNWLLGQADMDGLTNASSFTDAIFRENTEGFTLESYTIPRGTWFSAINALLGFANASLRWNAAGELEYFKFRPSQPDSSSVFTFKAGSNMRGLKVRQPEGAVINAANVERSDGAGGNQATTSSPIQDSTSIARHGERQADFSFTYETDFPADQIAAEEMFYQAEVPTIFTFQGDQDSFTVELGDVVTIHDYEGASIQNVQATVFQKSINPRGHATGFLAMDTFLTSQPWLWTDENHQLDGSRKVW